jgi:flagellar L-ring protein FlgH
MRRLHLIFSTYALLGMLACSGAAKKTQGVESGLEQYARQARALAVNTQEINGSLWTETSRLSDVYRDVKARRVADIVTIQVLESTSAVTEASTDSLKETQMEAGAGTLFGLERRVAELPSLISANRSSQFTGDASTSRTSVLRTSIAARVVEVFPNGHLLVEGNREIVVNNERQIITVRGVVRPEDISPQNNVLSTNVAELEVEVKGRGIVSRAQEPGILFKILSGFWPF